MFPGPKPSEHHRSQVGGFAGFLSRNNGIRGTESGRGSSGRGSDRDGQGSDRGGRVPDREGRGFDRSGQGSDRGGRGFDRGGRGSGRGGRGSDRGGRGFDRGFNDRGARGFERRDDSQAYSTRGRGGYQRNHPPSVMSRDTIEDLLLKSPDEALILVASPRSGFIELLQSFDKNTIESVILLLSKLCDVLGSPATLIGILQKVSANGFLISSVVPYLSQCLIAWSIKASYVLFEETEKASLLGIFGILEKLIHLMPAAVADSVTIVLGQLQQVVAVITSHSLKNLLEEKIQHIQELQSDVIKQIQGGTLVKEQMGDEEDIEPPNNFRQISIIPTAQDMRQNIEPYLRKNRITGQYRNADQYLDIQFRLLREDYVFPLRQGIRELVRCGDKEINERTIQDVNIYSDVTTRGIWYSEKGAIHRFHFNIHHLKKVNWEISHRLINGSLVCLSCDKFKTIAIGTVAERDPKHLSRGLIDILVDENANFDSNPCVIYKMVESSAYFEAYRHNLEGLQEFNETNLPFQPYLLNTCHSEAEPPRYLRERQPEYDFGPLLQPRKKRLVNALNKKMWPTASELSLDQSQYKALHLAITKEFAIIQGPPGTGKTYIGLKIVELLLHNFDVWGHGLFDRLIRHRVKCPILIVCYTNHALDQFLEGILQFRDSTEGQIVRVGGRSNSENKALIGCQISNLKRNDDIRHRIPQEVREAKSDTRNQMEGLEVNLMHLGQQITNVKSTILHEQYLLHVMHPNHRLAFERMTYGHPHQGRRSGNLMHQCHMTQWLLGNSPGCVEGQEEWDDGMDPDEDEDDIGSDDETDLSMGEVDTEDMQGARNLCIESDDEEDVRLGERSKRLLDVCKKDIVIPNIGMNPQSPWQTVVYKKKLKKLLLKNLNSNVCMSDEEEASVNNIWILPAEKRWRLYRSWINKLCTDCTHRMQNDVRQYNQLAKQLAEFRDEEDISILMNAEVIALTTTGAAKYRRLLRRVQPRIVIVEEAAEVLEAHIITSLTQNCQHLILIGDHQQLRPNPTVYKLAKTFHLDISLFERMVRNKLHSECLNVQHRMRPEIASLIVPHIYKTLENHPSVSQYSDVPGISGNLYFISHSHSESRLFDSRSHTNTHEAEFLTALCKYLIQQGITPEQITILVTYRGQMYETKKNIKASEKTAGVRVTPVDNYQGEENDVILLSLVRSNEEGKIGFLKIANRICVALSRAKKGFYVIGDFNLLSNVSPVWKAILKYLQEEKKLVDGLALQCQNHPDTSLIVKTASDFDQAPEGGCSKPCQSRLKCGHVCRLKCHPYDQKHEDYKCLKPCLKRCSELRHDCARVCSEDCGKCKIPTEKIMPACEHTQKVPCSTSVEKYTCREPCEKPMLLCDHMCPKTCGEECQDECPIIVPNRLWPCGHTLTVQCYKNASNYKCTANVEHILPCSHSVKLACSADLTSFTCTKVVELMLCSRGCKNKVPCYMVTDAKGKGCQVTIKKMCEVNQNHQYQAKCSEYDTALCTCICNSNLECGHGCKGKCGDCSFKKMHAACKMSCSRRLPCQHQCSGKCCEPCGPCRERCKNGCMHKICNRTCGEPCLQCEADCSWVCQHKKCTKKCTEICDRTVCTKNCPHLLRCGHKCPAYCGESCPQSCPICHSKFYQQMYISIGLKQKPNDKYVMLFPCSHVIVTTFMDDHVGKYLQQTRQTPRKIVALSCPICKEFIHCCPRYKEAIYHSHKDSEKVKKAIKASHDITSQLATFESGADIVTALQNLSDVGTESDKQYARECMGCMSILQAAGNVVNKMTRSKNSPFTVLANQLIKEKGEFGKKLKMLAIDGVNSDMMKIVSVQAKMFFMQCHAQYMLSYVKNDYKQSFLRGVVHNMESTRDGTALSTGRSSRQHMKTELHRACHQMVATIPQGLRNGINDYMEEIEKYFTQVVDFHLERTWILCSQLHVFAAPGGNVTDITDHCPVCKVQEIPEIDHEKVDGLEDRVAGLGIGLRYRGLAEGLRVARQERQERQEREDMEDIRLLERQVQRARARRREEERRVIERHVQRVQALGLGARWQDDSDEEVIPDFD